MAEKSNFDHVLLSSRAYNALIHAGITSVAELMKRSARDLLLVKNFGRKSLTEVENVLAERNLSLKAWSRGERTRQFPME